MSVSARSHQFNLESLEARILLSAAPSMVAGGVLAGHGNAGHPAAVEVALHTAGASEDFLNHHDAPRAGSHVAPAAHGSDIFGGLDAQELTAQSANSGTQSPAGDAASATVHSERGSAAV